MAHFRIGARFGQEARFQRTTLADDIQGRLFDELSFHNDTDVSTQFLDDFEDMRGQEHGRTPGDEACQQVADNGEVTASTPSKGSSRKSKSGLAIRAAASRQFLLHAVRVFQSQLFLFVFKAQQRISSGADDDE